MWPRFLPRKLILHAALSHLKKRLHNLTLNDTVDKIVRYGGRARVSEREHYDAPPFDIPYKDMLAGHWDSEPELWRMLEDFLSSHSVDSAAH